MSVDYSSSLIVDEIYVETKKRVEEQGLSCGLNVLPVIRAIVKLMNEKPGDRPLVITQFGVFKGATLLSIAHACRVAGVKARIAGFDTFDGFPAGVLNSPYDKPSYFKTLLEMKKITPTHFELARARTNDFRASTHLESSYFATKDDVLNLFEDFSNVNLIKGSFQETLKTLKTTVDIIHLDCDLYQSYKTVLESMWARLNSGGYYVFDEYYSLKYPGARVAVDEFFSGDRAGSFEMFVTDDGFERWSFRKA